MVRDRDVYFTWMYEIAGNDALHAEIFRVQGFCVLRGKTVRVLLWTRQKTDLEAMTLEGKKNEG